MNWDAPSKSKWFAGAAIAVLVASLFCLRDRTPRFLVSAPDNDPGMRDAVASPAMVAGGAAWFKSAPVLGRAALYPDLPRRIQAADILRRPTSGRAVFRGGRVIVDHARPGVPEPVLTPKPDSP
ncbi:MAG TPA: hypothetical protein DEB40_10530 [Elusimicrobia bacterium]|nr:hypothetical protein [Elusimicrobiota bacterium]HBT62165.1 hypothetical protein [Elusimicrobiota bacterium]